MTDSNAGRVHLTVLLLSTSVIVGALSTGGTQGASGKSSGLRHDAWGIELSFEGHTIWSKHPLRKQPNFVFAANARSGRCRINLSMFAIHSPAQGTATECRKDSMGNPEELAGESGVTIHDQQPGPIAYTLYDMAIDPETSGRTGLTQNQLFGYWTRRDTCFELHVSSINCSDFAAHALPILASVRIDPDREVTIETIAIARDLKKKPDDWQVHLAAAGSYLHESEPPIPHRARRFYESALALGSGIDPDTMWTIEEGIGLSWLMEGEGDKALAHLSISLRLARGQKGNDGGPLDSSLYNIARASSLVGQVEEACRYLDELLDRQPPEQRKLTLKDIKKDAQLKPMRKADCYKPLRKKKR